MFFGSAGTDTEMFADLKETESINFLEDKYPPATGRQGGYGAAKLEKFFFRLAADLSVQFGDQLKLIYIIERAIQLALGSADMIKREIAGDSHHESLRIAYLLSAGCSIGSHEGFLDDVLDFFGSDYTPYHPGEQAPATEKTFQEIFHAVMRLPALHSLAFPPRVA